MSVYCMYQFSASNIFCVQMKKVPLIFFTVSFTNLHVTSRFLVCNFASKYSSYWWIYDFTCHVHPLPGDVMTSVKSCLLPIKINISLKFCGKKTLQLRIFFLEFPNKNWNRRGLDNLIKKIDKSVSTAQKSGSGTSRLQCLSQEDKP